MRNFIMALVALLMFVSCGKLDPVHPELCGSDLDRAGMTFQTAVEIFSGDADYPTVDADNCEVINSIGSGSEGTPWEDSSGNH